MNELVEFLKARWDAEERDGYLAEECGGCCSGCHCGCADSGRVLRMVAAKRRLLELHGGQPYPNPGDELVDMECTTFGAELRYPEQCSTLKLLAEHEGWKP
jgi:hypothetical protein